MVQTTPATGQPVGSGSPHPVPRVVVTDHAFDAVAREHAAAEAFGADFEVFHCRTEHETLAAVTGAAAVLVNLAPITRRVLEALAPGAVVIRYGVGYDNVDTAAAAELGVAVANTADYGTETVADHSAALLLGLLRRVRLFDEAVRADGWSAPLRFGDIASFADLTVGLVGTGRIGLALADRLRPFGFRLIAHDPFIDQATAEAHGVALLPLTELLTQSNALSLHLPLTAQTHHFIGTDALALLPAGAVLVNTARGGLVDTAALCEALASGHVAGAALDVFEDEPLPQESELRAFDQVVLTPHVAFYSTASMANLQAMAAAELERALRGEPLKGRVA
jgi:D-3-phosphoglycerate dehydrogenase / 2-oxoglutarate reductase